MSAPSGRCNIVSKRFREAIGCAGVGDLQGIIESPVSATRIARFAGYSCSTCRDFKARELEVWKRAAEKHGVGTVGALHAAHDARQAFYREVLSATITKETDHARG